MKYKIIPNTSLSVSVVSLGTWAFSGDVWGAASQKDCIAAVRAAVESGINLIDTAPIYGYGRSEEMVGKAIRGIRDKVIIATKCGLKGKGVDIKTDLSASFIEEEIESSLKRLGVEYIDLYQCHWPDEKTPIEETMKKLSELKAHGRIRHIGLSNHTPEQIEEASKYADIATTQEHYSLLERKIEKNLIPYCIKNNIGILTYGSLGGGILTGKYKSQPNFKPSDARGFFYKYYSAEEFERAERIVSLIKDIALKKQKPVNQVAINWIWQKNGIASAIVGSRNAQQAIDNAHSADWSLSEEELSQLNNE